MLKYKKFFTWINNNELDIDWINSEYYRPEFVKIENSFKKNQNLNTYKMNRIANINRVTGFEVEKYLKIVDNGVPYLRVKNIEPCCINFTDMQHIPKEVHNIFRKSQFKAQDIALTITGRVGTAAIIPDGMQCNACQDVVKISIKKGININPYYLTLYLNSYYNYMLLNRFNSGGSRPRTLINNVRDVRIPIPSPEIQKYIGDKVRKAEELKEEAKKLKDEAEEMLLDNLSFTKEDFHKKNYSKFVWVGNTFLYDRIDCQYYDALYEYIEKKLKKNKCVALIDLCMDYSITVPYSTDFGQRSNDDIYPMYRVKNINEYIVNTEDLVYMNCRYYNKNENCRVFAGDILLSRVGSIGRACIYLDNKNASMGQNVTRIRLKDNINKFYFLCYINSRISRLLMQRETNAGLQSNITNENIKELMIPILERNIQDEIGNKILKYIQTLNQIKQLINQAMRDVEDLIEGTLDMSKVKKDL